MAQEAILSVSLKEYKQQINELKESMLGLDKASKEYADKANQAASMQQKLNDVMYDAKKGADVGANSISALEKQYRELTKQAKSLDVGSKQFQEVSKAALDVRNKLDDANNSIGNWSTNVGNYTNAIKQSFSSAIPGLNEVIGLFTTLKSGINEASTAGTGLKGVFEAIGKVGLIAILTSLFAIIQKVKEAINGNEEASKRWKVAMAAFDPIIRGINKVFQGLADVVISFVEWVGKNMPKVYEVFSNVFKKIASVLQGFGNIIRKTGDVIGGLAKVATFLPRTFLHVFTELTKIVGEGVKGIASGVAKLLDAVGADEWANKLKNAANTAVNGAVGALNTLVGAADNVDSFISGVFNSAANGLDNAASKMQSVSDKMQAMAVETIKSQQLAKQQADLDTAIRQQEIASAESELRQQQLREELAKETDPKKRLELLGKIREEVQKTGEAELRLAKQQVALQKQINDLAPNSREDNIYFENLQKNVLQTQARTEASLTGVEKMITKIEGKASKTASTVSKEAAKAAKEAEAKAKAASQEVIKDTATAIEAASLKVKQELIDLEALEESLGNQTIKHRIETEDKKWAILQTGFDAQIKLYEEALKQEGLLEQDREILENKLIGVQLAAGQALHNHRVELNKLFLEDVKRTQAEAEKLLSATTKTQVTELKTSKTTEIIEAQSTFVNSKGTEADYEAYQQELLKISQKYAEAEKQLALDNANAQLEIKQQTLNALVSKYADKTPELAEAYKSLTDAISSGNEQAITDQINNFVKLSSEAAPDLIESLTPYLDAVTAAEIAQTELEAEQSEQRIENKRRETKEKEEQIKQEVKSYQDLAKSVGSIMGTMSDIFEENIKQQVKDGKITDEQAKKKFKSIKALQISEAVINTLSTGLSSFMAVWKDKTIEPSWLRGIIAGTTLAGTLATGYAQVNKIKNTQFGSSGSGGGTIPVSSISAPVAVSPKIDQNQDAGVVANLRTSENTENISDQRVYILQSDLEESHKQVEVREFETTF